MKESLKILTAPILVAIEARGFNLFDTLSSGFHEVSRGASGLSRVFG